MVADDPADRLAAIGHTLLALAHDLRAPGAGERAAGGGLQLGVIARRAYGDRRRRAAVFGDEALFGEPAWDVLLDLFVAAQEGKRVAVTSACIGAAVPATTALRWLAVLERKGLVRREADADDARRVFVRLSGEGFRRMAAYFAA
ncbi:MAG: winged helix DNA-binding protein [Sphingomonadales bacterium]|nr:winged helix DNA-binding protein [Sphingomonadales bacterium]